MNTAVGVVGGLVVGAVIGFGAATMHKGGHSGGGNEQVLMELDGAKFKESDLPPDIRSSIYEAREENYDRVNGILNQFALQFSLAKEKNKDVKIDALPPLDELVEAQAPSDDEMKKLYEANKERLPPNTTFEQIKPEIAKYMKNQKVSETLRSKNDEFKAKNRLKLVAEAPVPPHVNLSLDAYPAKGQAAGHTLVEVADYLCPHCQAIQPEVEEVLKTMGDKFKFVPVSFSLHPEGLSGTLARGAYCARQESESAFWKWNDTAFATGKAKAWKATDPDSKDIALEVADAVGLQKEKFLACVGSDAAKKFVDTTVASMHKAGVSGTPTFFLDGRKLAVTPGKSLKELIEAGMQNAASH